VCTITWAPSSTSAKIPRCTSSTFRLPPALVKFANLGAFAGRATSTTQRRSRTSSRRPSSLISTSKLSMMSLLTIVL
ncbi:hypothetical protein DXG03_004822, partial [Asterophora parasitica]